MSRGARTKPTSADSPATSLPLAQEPCAAPPDAAERKLTLSCHVAAWLAAVVLFSILCSFSDKSVTWPNDHFSDMNVLLSGENFAKHGFWRLHFLPVQYIGDLGEPPNYYLHYPPLPNLLNGVMQSMGITSLAVMRACMALVFVAGLFLTYWALAPKLGPLTSLCGMIFMGSSAYTLTHGMSLHTHAYDVLFGGLMLLTFFRALEHGPGWRRMWAACWCVLFVQSLSTYEFILYAQIFMWVYVLATRQFRANALALAVLASAPVAGVGLHVLQNIWAVGWQQVMQDSLGVGHFTGESRWTLYAKLPQDFAEKTAGLFIFRWPVLLVMGLLWLGLATVRRLPGMKLRPTQALCAASLVAGVAWYVFLPAHAIAHIHMVNQLFLLTYLAVGGLLATALVWVASRGVSLPLRAGGLAILVTVCVMQGRDWAGAAKSKSLPNFVIAQALNESNAIPPDCAIFTNTAAEAQVRYFLRRPLWPCPSPDFSLPQDEARLPQHPSSKCRKKYFLFFGPADHDLLDYLSGNCPGMAMGVPFIINPERFMVLFDISDLYLPPKQRVGLDPNTRRAQLNGGFETWEVPTFRQSIRAAILQQMEQSVGQTQRDAAQPTRSAKPANSP